MYSLDNCIRRNIRFKRPNHVIRVLTDNDILDWDDFVAKPIPTKRLWQSEITILNDMREKEKRIRIYKNKGSDELYCALAKYFSKHETTRVFNILMSHNVSSVRIFLSIYKSDLDAMYGIGPKSLSILMKIKTELWNRAGRMLESTNGMGGGNYVAQPLLVGFN